MRLPHSKTIAAAAVAIAAVSPALASSGDRVQGPQQSSRDAARILTPTWKTFSTEVGGGTKIVVSTGGNITSFASPNKGTRVYEHIGVGAVGEGYVLCYNGSSTSRYDLGASASGFNAPTTTASNVTRTTTDGMASLIQTFGLTAGNPGSPTTFQVGMTVE